MKIYLLIIIFLLIGALFIISEDNLSLLNKDSRDIFVKNYIGWIGKLASNSRSILGDVIKLNWLPKGNTTG